MDVLNVPVTLIVKAPNQQVEDQTVQCELNWTIKKLKGYLSEVYPSKPRAEDQKLIYSGHLLQDSVVLKDILRRDDGHNIHTVHLVCTPTKDSRKATLIKRTPRMTNNTNRQQQRSTGEPSHSRGQTNPEHNTDGLRHRVPYVHPQSVPISSNTPTIQPDARTMWGATGMGYPYVAVPASSDPTVFAQQCILMQQYYAQYLAHLHSASQSGQTPSANSANPQTEGSPVPERPETPEVEQNRAGRQQENDVLAEPEEEEGGGNRDWLDWFYLSTRIVILLSVVYFYSSVTRLIIVLALAALLFLYHRGYLHIHQVQPENNNNVPAARLIAENNNVQQEENVQDPGQEERNTPNVEAPQSEVQPDRPSLPTVMWTMITSFFTSIIPEQPAAL